MVVAATLTEADVLQLANEVFSHAPEPWRKPELIIRAEPDFSGDDAVYVTAIFPNGVGRLSGPEQIDLQIEIGDLLIARGDHRLVYLSALSRSDFDELRTIDLEDPPDAP